MPRKTRSWSQTTFRPGNPQTANWPPYHQKGQQKGILRDAFFVYIAPVRPPLRGINSLVSKVYHALQEHQKTDDEASVFLSSLLNSQGLYLEPA